jgi:RNA polymerase sigma-70 factor, ECF subfamily
LAVLRDARLESTHLLQGTGDVCSEDDAKLTALYAAHGASIHRFLSGLLGDRVLAADATQETFVRAHRRLGSFREGGRHVAWLFGIARNVSLELRKARARANRYFDSASDPRVGHEPDVAAPGSPESDLLGREALGIVESALGRLSEERRAMLLLRLDHGLAYDEIAELMGCSLAKVKVEIFRAREVLRSQMADYEKGERR